MKLVPLALAAAVALGAGASLAQPAPAPAPEGRQRAQHDPAEMAQRHAEHLRAALQLRPDQEPALRALIAALQPEPGKMEQMRAEHGERDGLTTPQRLDRLQALMAEHQAGFTRKADAIRRFYAQLSPAQQRAFDALPMVMMMMMHGHHEGMGGMPGHERPHGMGPGQPPPPVG